MLIQDDLLVGSPAAMRNLPELQRVIGLFANTLVYRTDLSGTPSYRQLIGRVRAATPGRLLDLLGQGSLHLNDINLLVLDEVDRMLDMGFLPDVRKIIDRCPKTRQTLLFSATIPPEIGQLAAWVLRNPEKIEIGANLKRWLDAIAARPATKRAYAIAKEINPDAP